MVQRTSLNRKMETVISITVLLALIVVVISILFVQNHFDLAAFGIANLTSEKEIIETTAFFSVSDDFEVFSDEEHYGPDELYEKINGKAPLYTDAGFEMLDTQRFTFKPDPQCWIEIYRYTMTSPESAFCVYSTQKRPSGAAIEGINPEYGYKTTSGMYLAAGNKYYEISASAENEAVLEALRACLPQIAELSLPENKFMPMPRTLPDENAVAGSFKLYLDGAFGIGGLGEVYMRDYVLEGQRLTAFTITDGKVALEKYEQFMEENGAEKTGDADGIAAFDLYGVYEIMGLAGGNLVGVHEADDADLGRELIKMITVKTAN